MAKPFHFGHDPPQILYLQLAQLKAWGDPECEAVARQLNLPISCVMENNEVKRESVDTLQHVARMAVRKQIYMVIPSRTTAIERIYQLALPVPILEYLSFYVTHPGYYTKHESNTLACEQNWAYWRCLKITQMRQGRKSNPRECKECHAKLEQGMCPRKTFRMSDMPDLWHDDGYQPSWSSRRVPSIFSTSIIE